MSEPSMSLPADVDSMAYISHELTTPITTIRWNAELLRMGKMTTPLDAEQAKVVDEILLGVSIMSNLVNDIHESSWLERDKFADAPVPTVLAEVVSTAQEQQAAAIGTKKLTVKLDVDTSLPPIVARPSTLLLIAQNLISNAVKYTLPEGSVTVSLRFASDEEAAKSRAGGGCVVLCVADTGIGIPAEQQDQVFNKFFRADNARSLNIEGTGFGLYIVDLAVQKLDGVVWFESAEQKGSSFYVLLPLKN